MVSNSTGNEGKKQGPPSTAKPTVPDRALGPAADSFGDEFRDVGKDAGAVAKRAARVFLKVGSGVVWSMEFVVDWFEKTVNDRLKDVPQDQIAEPDPRIMLPAMQALTYTGSDETIRELFARLITADLTTEGKKNVHPSFVELIKQMTSVEANIVKLISERGPQRYTELRLSPLGKQQFNTVAGGYSFDVEGVEFTGIRTAISNLERLGLLRIQQEYLISQEFDDLDTKLLEKYRSHEIEGYQLKAHPNGIVLTPLGETFAAACIL